MIRKLVILTLMGVLASCKSTTVNPVSSNYDSYNFNDASVANSNDLNPNDPVAVFHTSKAIYKQGDVVRSVALLEDLKVKYKSENGRFNRDCQAEICLIYLKGGQLDKFELEAKDLLSQRDIYGKQYKQIERAYNMIQQDKALN